MTEKPVDYISLKEIFQNRRFIIPDYQRGYSWGLSQVNDLKKDIERLRENELTHFTGTIVGVYRKNEDVYELVDGQQRLTTLLILLKAIYDSNNNRFNEVIDYYFERDIDGVVKPVFTPNEETASFFRSYIINGNKSQKIQYDSHANLENAKKVFDDWLEELNPEDIYSIVTNRLNFIFFCPSGSSETGMMFEVINNRGKLLSQLEKIKNYLIYYATIHGQESFINQINDEWGNILCNLNTAGETDNQAEDRFMRYAYIVFFDPNKEKSWEVYDQLKERFDISDKKGRSRHINQMKDFVGFLGRASFAYAQLLDRETASGTSKQMQKQLSYLRCHPVNASVLPVYFSIMTKNDLSESDKIELLEIIEKLNFRVYVLPRVTSRADSKQGHLFRLAHEFFLGKYSAEELKKELMNNIQTLCDVRTFIKHLTVDDDESEDYYRWNGIKYFLGRYEQQKRGDTLKKEWELERIKQTRKETAERSGDYVSVEHIWARKHRIKDFTEDHMQKRRLGNFVLMELRENIKAGKKGIREKIRLLRDRNTVSELIQVDELDELYSLAEKSINPDDKRRRTKNYYLDLSTKLNDLREIELIEFALTTWHIEGDDPTVFLGVDSFTRSNNNEKYLMKPREMRTNE